MMAVVKVIVLFVVICCLAKGISAASYQNYTDLFKNMFKDYNINLRPVRDDSSAVQVKVDFVLLSIEGISEQEQTITTSGWMLLEWRDEILTWNPADYNDVYALQVQQKIIWRPDIVIKNSVKQRSQMGFDEQPVLIQHNGTVVWAPGDIFETSCDLSITYYPFDIQTCEIKVYLWLSDDEEIKLVSGKGNIGTTFYSENGQWELVNTTANVVSENNQVIEVAFGIKMKRRQRFYIVTIIIPILFLSCLGPLVFALPSDSGEKMGFSVTVLLAYTVFLTIIGDNMPQTSTQTAILSIYLTAMLTISALSVILSVVSLRIYHKSPDTKPYSKVQSLTRLLRKCLCLRDARDNAVTPSNNNDSDDELRKLEKREPSLGQPEVTWKMVSETWDAFFLFVFSILTALFTVPSLITMASQSIAA